HNRPGPDAGAERYHDDCHRFGRTGRTANREESHLPRDHFLMREVLVPHLLGWLLDGATAQLKVTERDCCVFGPCFRSGFAKVGELTHLILLA
ncbi:MAG TPA: hypothetical protein P5074_10280, partial [Candidatus Nanopelagicales bacterium]|nr:hypothetical protein [Candidatus Nanopelagicales bacterium]